jgi:dethiobiotin synthetase
MGKALFVTGTGTDIGKSALSLALVLWARAKGLRCVYYKPIQCGTFFYGMPQKEYGDAEWVSVLAGNSLTVHVTYPLRMSAGPHLAAEKEKVSIDLGRIKEDFFSLAGTHDLVVMEGAGGCAVPVNRAGDSLAGLAGELSLQTIIACAPSLGTLHHTLTTVAYLKALAVPVSGFVFCHRATEVLDICADNRITLETLTHVPCLGELSFCPELALGPEMFSPVASAWGKSLSAGLETWWNRNPK